MDISSIRKLSAEAREAFDGDDIKRMRVALSKVTHALDRLTGALEVAARAYVRARYGYRSVLNEADTDAMLQALNALLAEDGEP